MDKETERQKKLAIYAEDLLEALKNLLDPTYGDTMGRLAEKEARQLIKELEQ